MCLSFVHVHGRRIFLSVSMCVAVCSAFATKVAANKRIYDVNVNKKWKIYIFRFFFSWKKRRIVEQENHYPHEVSK